ncbi:hypothetical protein DsansV1_C14g0131111 [Dioscorea sansibarensis]
MMTKFLSTGEHVGKNVRFGNFGFQCSGAYISTLVSLNLSSSLQRIGTGGYNSP